SPRRLEARIREVSQRYGMPLEPRRLVHGLSIGERQRVEIVRCLMQDIRLLILDEPTRGIDVGAKYEIYGIINELAAQGKAVIVISSELPEVIGLSDRIYTISEGRITAEVSRADATQE
ncbi:ATP-binding cassette domain-containing protein, partial [Acinetobacter baumannii]